uniref:Uncharacterized protein n=1 Tax=Anguilla anguilla TaxID=7936 RepID=A0A0E9XJW3_ANGAN
MNDCLQMPHPKKLSYFTTKIYCVTFLNACTCY